MSSAVPNWITAAATLVVAGGVVFAYWQVRVSAKASRAQLLLHFNTMWDSAELYEATSYVHGLRTRWLDSGRSFEDLAHDWVERRAPSHSQRSWRHRQERREWLLRRRVSQYMRHAGYMLEKKYLKADDVFSTNPEVGKLLQVILPLENAVIDYYASDRTPTADWDRMAKKRELDTVGKVYQRWVKKKGERSFGRHELPAWVPRGDGSQG
jgi:hypothetical protein